MKKIIVLVCAFGVLFSCKEGAEAQHIPSSSGRLNNLSVVVDHQNWKGEIGEHLRKVLASPVDGLPQQEPMFNINHIPTNAFTGFVRNNRTFVKIIKTETPYFSIVTDTFAKPQTGIFIGGSNIAEITKEIDEQKPAILKAIRDTEITEKQRRIAKSLKDDKKITEKLHINIDFPTAYRYAKEGDDFFWIRKDIPKGSMEILLYQVPLSKIDENNVVADIIKIRDSIGKKYIPGPSGDVEDSYMRTEEAFSPYLFTTKIDGKFAYETKGTWDVKGAFMAGPFVNYAIRDEKNNRYLIAEGFLFRPSVNKRDHMLELEAILKSIKFKN